MTVQQCLHQDEAPVPSTAANMQITCARLIRRTCPDDDHIDFKVRAAQRCCTTARGGAEMRVTNAMPAQLPHVHIPPRPCRIQWTDMSMACCHVHLQHY